MMILRNLRQQQGRHGPEMAADFTIADGRTGCVAVSLSEFDRQGERALEQEAAACAGQARRHGYRSPGADRYAELE